MFPEAEVAAVNTKLAEEDESTEDGMDLNCKERVEDSDTDSQSDDEHNLIENKVFPQQRFSPVMKPLIPAADITYRPKPIKMKPNDSPIKGETKFTPGSENNIPRPASPKSTFQPKGLVFRTTKPKPDPLVLRSEESGSRPSSTKSDTVVQLLQHRGELQKNSSSPASASSRVLQRSNSVSNVSAGPTTVGQHLQKAASLVRKGIVYCFCCNGKGICLCFKGKDKGICFCCKGKQICFCCKGKGKGICFCCKG